MDRSNKVSGGWGALLGTEPPKKELKRIYTQKSMGRRLFEHGQSELVGRCGQKQGRKAFVIFSPASFCVIFLAVGFLFLVLHFNHLIAFEI